MKELRDRRIMMVRPDHYEVCYAINPWMKPGEWSRDPEAAARIATSQWQTLADTLAEVGLVVEAAPGQPGLPDMVFPANAAIVLDGKALVARFRYPERQGEEAHFLAWFKGLVERGLLDEALELPEGVFQEGAGDCIWDERRQLFWAGHGQRSTEASIGVIERTFGQKVAALELATPHYYHLDTCFLVLSGGEVIYFPDALTKASREVVAAHVESDLLIAAGPEDAAAFSLNAVNVGRDVVMAAPPPRLRAMLEERGYRCHGLDLSSYKLSGGAAYCMTLRLDRRSRARMEAAA